MEKFNKIDIKKLKENIELELKEAAGKDGRGALPDSFFPTYSSMANTKGGVVLLGIKEKPKGVYTINEIKETEKVIKSLWDQLNDRDKVSINILRDNMVKVVEVEGKNVIHIHIPRAERRQKPVYVGKNPLNGTYIRLHESDYKCEVETIKRMFAEQVEESRDQRIIKNYSLNDLDIDTIKAYRSQFKTNKPDHVWNDIDDKEFLEMIGGWRKSRENDEEGLTIAGLLMFGKFRPILNELPYYVIDYQEKLDIDEDTRWSDRITTDGSWSGNLFDFFRRTIRKIIADIKVPFKLNELKREDDTPVHEALREAMINTLIHADFLGRTSLLVVKKKGMFIFRNPGTMRVSIEKAINGGHSDCRNRILQKMFQFVGFGEQAGSGIPKIFNGWESQHWQKPIITEDYELDETCLELKMVSLIPDEIFHELEKLFGNKFRSLQGVEILALATAISEGKVTCEMLKEKTSTHPSEITKSLSMLVKEDYLVHHGKGRGTHYTLRNKEKITTQGEHSGQLAMDLIHPANEIISKIRKSKDEIKRSILSMCMKKDLSIKEISNSLEIPEPELKSEYLVDLWENGSLEIVNPREKDDNMKKYRSRV